MPSPLLEKDIEKTVKRYAESKGWLTRKWTSPGHMFVPDQIFITPYGHVIFIEFKIPISLFSIDKPN